jgi:hypothetical protein
MDITSISSAYTGIKIVKDLISALLSAKIEVATKEKINEALEKLGLVQDALFYLREELARLQTENAQLKEKLKDKKAWEVRLAEYQLEKTAGGAVVYSFKGEPKHYACPSCVTKREIQILQDRQFITGEFDCPGCGKTFPVKASQGPELRTL